MSEAVGVLNQKVAELLKSASTEEVVELLKDEKSLLRAMHNNNNQNTKS